MPARTKKPARPAEIVSRGEAELIPPAVPDDVIDSVYNTLRSMARDASLGLYIDMGKVIVTKFYGGDLATWRDRGQKDASFRKLAARFDRDEDAPEGTSAAGLYRAVSIYIMDKQWGVSDRKHLTMTHVRALIGLPDMQQKRLLAAAEKEEWSGDRVEREAAKVRKKEGDGRGRPPLPGFVKGATRFRRILDGDDLFGEIEKAADMGDKEVEAVLKTVTDMETKLQSLRAGLEARLGRKD